MRERINIALEFLKLGQSYTIYSLRLGIRNHYVYVTGWSRCISVESLTKQMALDELDEVKELFGYMVKESPALAAFLEGKNIKFNLCLNPTKDFIPIVSEYVGAVMWERELI
jgi:hypothetical protein